MGSKKKTTVGYYYFLGVHLVFCHGPIDSVSEIIADKKVAWNGTNTGGPIIFFNLNLFGGDDKEGGLAGQFDMEFGGPAQGQNPYLVSKIPDLVPAFRGLVGMVCRQIYVGTSTYLKNIAIRASRIHVRTSQGIAQWYDAKSQVLAFGGERVLWTEEFANGIEDYDLISGDLTKFSVLPGTYGQQLNWEGSASVNLIRTDLPAASYFTGVTLKFMIRELRNDDHGGIYFRDSAGNPVFSFLMAREQFYESAQRPNIQFVDAYGQYGNPIGTTHVDVNVWYELNVNYDQAAGQFVAVVKRLSDNVIHGTLTIAAAIGNQISTVGFGTDGYTNSGPVSATDIVIRTRTVSPDMNPAHIIRECLTDPDWGMGYQDADIDDTAFMAAADKLFSEGMGISILWNRQTSIEEFIGNIVKHIDASVFLDRATGKFVLKLIRDDYTLGSLITLNGSNIDKIENFTRPTTGELTNSVTVKYWDSGNNVDASVTVQDIALVQMQQATVATKIDYPGFTNAIIASRVAQRDLRTLSTPIVSCTIYANKDASVLSIGSAFKLTWPDYNLNALVMRVTGIAYGDGKNNRVRITCTQDIYSLPLVPVIVPDPPTWIDPNPDPLPATQRMAFEAPYLEAVQQQGQATVDSQLAANNELAYVGIGVGRPGPAYINAGMYTDAGGGYGFADDIDFSPSCTLTSAIDKLTTTFAVADETDIALAPDGTWLQCDNEIMVKVSFASPNLTVKRGALDTVPDVHSTGALLVFWDTYSAFDETQYTAGESVNVKVTPRTGKGELALAEAPVDVVNTVGRMYLPYAPGQFKLNATSYPASLNAAITVSWVHRDRLLQTGSVLLGTMDAGVGPEPGTTYTVRYYNSVTNALLTTQSGLSGLSSTPFTPSVSTLRVELESVRAGFTSYQKHTHTFTYSVSFSRVTEVGDRRVTEAGDPRVTEPSVMSAVATGVIVSPVGRVHMVARPSFDRIVWAEVASAGNTTIKFVNNADLTSLGSTVYTDTTCTGLATSGNFTYAAFTITSVGDGRVVRLDHTNPTGAATHNVTYTDPLLDCVVCAGSLWVASPYDAFVLRMSLADLSITAYVTTAVGIYHLATDGTYVYGVAQSAAADVYKIDPATNTVTSTINLAGATLSYVTDFNIVGGAFAFAPSFHTRSMSTGAVVTSLTVGSDERFDVGYGRIAIGDDSTASFVFGDTLLDQQATFGPSSAYGTEGVFVASSNTILLVSRAATNWSAELWQMVI